jgi:hypothetical protein
VIAQDAGKEDEAIGHYRHAIEFDPRRAGPHDNLATLFDQSGDSRSAIPPHPRVPEADEIASPCSPPAVVEQELVFGV